MAAPRSFTDYVRKRFDNEFWAAAESYLDENIHSLSLVQRRIHRAGEHEISNVKVEHVWVKDRPGMEIHFDVAVSIWFEVHEGDHHYDDSDENIVWMMLYCRGNLDKKLDDFEIMQVSEYNGKNQRQDPMDDSLVPIIHHDKLDDVATDFLNKYYPKALDIPAKGQPPIWVDPNVLAKSLGLSVKYQRIRGDASIIGQLYFDETDAELYDASTGNEILTHVEAKTIVVDPSVYLFGNLGRANNTVVHECVHWAKHRKAFMLEQLFNSDASHISCEVLGDADSRISFESTKYMEMQANQLAPRIQMPKGPFSAKAKEYIADFMIRTNAKHTVDVMEDVIHALERDFAVSRQAAKIRLVELGFEDAVGTFNFVDGHYVKPHGFRKGAISLNQTFTVSAQDAAIQRLMNLEFREKTSNGDYLFVDNHFVYNAPLYVVPGEGGKLELTDYARAHMDECCLVFDMTITSKVESTYHTICYLNREPGAYTFEVAYHEGFQNAPQSRQVAMRQADREEEIKILKQMSGDPEQCMKLLLDWRGMDYTELAAAIGRDAKTISRTVKGLTKPTPETAALICFGLNLPPSISSKFLQVLNCPLNLIDLKHSWINEALTLKWPEPVEHVLDYLEQYDVTL